MMENNMAVKRYVFCEALPIHQRPKESRAQIRKYNQCEGIHLCFQDRRERAGPNHFHRHRAETGGKQNPRIINRWPAEPAMPRLRRLRFSATGTGAAVSLRRSRAKQMAVKRDGEIARRGQPERVLKTQNFHQNQRRQESPLIAAKHVCQIKKTETLRVPAIPLPDESHHEWKRRAHAHAPWQDGDSPAPAPTRKDNSRNPSRRSPAKFARPHGKQISAPQTPPARLSVPPPA